MQLAALALALVPAWASAQSGDDSNAALVRFAQELREFRAGAAELEPRLDQASRELCAHFERCDAERVFAFYRGLTPESRRRGVQREAQFVAVWNRVRAAGDSGASGATWELERELALGDLAEIARLAELEPDFVPAAQARSLSARILTQQVDAASLLTHAAREQLAQRARELAGAACAGFERAGQITPQLEPRWLVGRLAARDHDFAAAARQFHACLALAEAVHSDEFRAHALESLLALARAAGDTREQDRRLAELARFRTPESYWPLARDWAARLLHRDFARAAVELLERCAPPGDAHVLDRSEWELLIGNALLRDGDFRGARAHLESLARTNGSELAVLSLASLALREGDHEHVLELLEAEELHAALSPLGRERAWALLGEAHHALGDFAQAIAALEQAFASAVEFERALLDERRDAVAGVAAGVIGERLGLHSVALWADALAQLGRPLDAVRVIEDAHARSLRRPDSTAVPAVEIGDLVDAAQRFELGFMTWVVGADFTVVAHVAPDGSAVCARVERGRSAIERAARRLREAAVAAVDDERCERIASEIAGELVPRAMRERVAGLATNAEPWPRLLLLAHGATESVPFELFDTVAWCGRDDLALSVRPNLPVRGARDAAMRAEWALCGGPLDTSGRDCLPGARSELEALRAFHPEGDARIGAEFERGALLHVLSGERALHLATHLVTDPLTPSEFGSASVLLTGGATLSADEIARHAPRLPLVVLATCSSGGGEFVDAEGLFGLARAFLNGGTESLIVTQWPIEDASAAAFGLALHRALASRATPTRALAMARRELAEGGARTAERGAFRALASD